jgi:hypothetical protein
MKKTTLCSILIAGLSASCAPVAPPAAPEAPGVKAPSATSAAVPKDWKSKCGTLRPLVVEWSAPERAALEAQARGGQLVVRYEGCELEVLRQCRAPAKFGYKYTSITPKEERVKMTSAEQLYASIPVYAARFEGKLARSGELSAEMTIVGEFGAEGEPPAIDQLEGECAGATHVISALTVGAFSFFAGASSEVGVSASVAGFGGGAERASKDESLSRDGDARACGASRRGDPSPPEGCGALVRVELAAVLPAGTGIPLQCKPGTRLVGRACKAVEKPSELSPDDRAFVDEGGVGWGTRCFHHLRAGSLHFARAACGKGLAASPSEDTRAAILFNYALVEERSGDPIAACEKLSQALALREGKAERAVLKVLRDKVGELRCSEVVRQK